MRKIQQIRGSRIGSSNIQVDQVGDDLQVDVANYINLGGTTKVHGSLVNKV